MKVTELGTGFGAKVSGIDIAREDRAEVISLLKHAYAEHHLLVFQGCGTLPPQRQVDVTGWFGPVLGDIDRGNAWTVLSNDNPSGRDELLFHSDISFMACPLDGISLHPLELPARGTTTSFVSNAAAWDALPAAIKKEIRPLRARHYYDQSQPIEMDWPELEQWHPVCLPHRKSGRPMLFVTEHHVDKIEGLGVKHNIELLRLLFDTLYQPATRYEHNWQDGDFLVWDNLAIQHARTRAAPAEDGPRVFRRVSIGEIAFRDQLETVRKAAPA